MSNILVVTEGADREVTYLNKCFTIIGKEPPSIFPYGCSAYSLYQILTNRYSGTLPINLVDVLKECNVVHQKDRLLLNKSYTDIYLVFDLDYQATKDIDKTNLVFSYLLSRFVESTDEGAMVVDYPMVESFRDIDRKTMRCDKEHSTISLVQSAASYKYLTSKRGIAHLSDLKSKEDYERLIFDHINRLFSLFSVKDKSYESFLKCTQLSLFDKVTRTMKKDGKIPVLCSILFIPVLYYGRSFYNECQSIYVSNKVGLSD